MGTVQACAEYAHSSKVLHDDISDFSCVSAVWKDKHPDAEWNDLLLRKMQYKENSCIY